MDTSVIIPNYNGMKYIEKCINSLEQQSYKDFEIIIVDNNSEDASKEIIRRYPDIKLIQLNENYGFAKAVNIGIKESMGKYVVLLNNDTIVEKKWLENLVKSIKNNKKIFSVSSKMINYNNREIIDDAGDLYTILGWAVQRGNGLSIKNHERVSQIFSSCGGAAIYRKDILDKIGLFDENFFAYLEDVDIGYRAKIMGYINLYNPNALVYHVGSATSSGGQRYSDFKVELSSRNNIFLIYMNMPYLQIIINLPFLLLGFIIKYFYFILKGFGNSYIRGIVNGLKFLKGIKNNNLQKNLLIYFKIEIELIFNTFKYIIYKLHYYIT